MNDKHWPKPPSKIQFSGLIEAALSEDFSGLFERVIFEKPGLGSGIQCNIDGNQLIEKIAQSIRDVDNAGEYCASRIDRKLLPPATADGITEARYDILARYFKVNEGAPRADMNVKFAAR